MITQDQYPKAWPLWQKVLFRFFFIYLLLHVLAFPLFAGLPVLGLINTAHDWLDSLAVNAFNSYILHFQDELVPTNGSGDTSYGWVQLIFYLVLASFGAAVWSVLDRRRKSYYRAAYYLNTTLRYFIAFVSFTYGFIKILALQMPFPSLHDMATPMGNFLPMRFSWHFIGSSTLYQVFSGAAEVTVGLLLLYRRTVTLGLFIGVGVYLNVMLINMAYDVPVKIFSTHMVIMCLYLLATDIKRIANFFIFNRPAVENTQYRFVPSKKSRRIFRLVLKTVFILNAGLMFVGNYEWYASNKERLTKELKPISRGLYEVSTFIKNRDTLPVLANDSLSWKDFIFDHTSRGNYATINSRDPLFQRSYGRGAFYYTADTIKHTLTGYKFGGKDSIILFNFRYNIKDKDHVELWGTTARKDSLRLQLTRSKREFKMEERQFHWLTEWNR